MPKRFVAPLALLALLTSLAPAQAVFDFSRTMRVDYLHSGGPGGEAFAIDTVWEEGEWAGSRTRALDDTDLGKYLFEVADLSSGRVLFSRGFASLYGEWETTPEVRAMRRSFHESIRFPWPDAAVRVVVKKRDGRTGFQTVWSTSVEPRAVRVPPAESSRVATLVEHGPADRKVDLLLISEGYSSNQLARFRADAARLVSAIFELEPFRSRRSDFNVRTLETPGTPLSVQFNILGLPRYVLASDNKTLRNLAAAAPYDVVEVLINDPRYGGGGIFNQQSTVAAANKWAAYLFIHELAHNLAGLADEYVGAVTYETGAAVTVEPWEPNITALLDRSALKWRDLVEPGTPIPTPLSHAGKVGAFEGAGYEARGLYRSEAECIMGNRDVSTFCRVCQRAINRVIDTYTR